MSKFVNSNFVKTDQWVHYNGKFVARFRNGGWREFKKFLVNNYSPEEYFARLDDGLAPLQVLMEKGYMSPNMKRSLGLL